MLSVDPEDGVQYDVAVKSWLARLAPYAQWARDGLRLFQIGKAVELMPDAVRMEGA